jgi:hypothetical protein
VSYEPIFPDGIRAVRIGLELPRGTDDVQAAVALEVKRSEGSTFAVILSPRGALELARMLTEAAHDAVTQAPLREEDAAETRVFLGGREIKVPTGEAS